MIRLCGLWKNKDKNGRSYLAGNLGGARILIFSNEKRSGDKAPDYNLCLAENEKKPGEGTSGAGGKAGGDDVPF